MPLTIIIESMDTNDGRRLSKSALDSMVPMEEGELHGVNVQEQNTLKAYHLPLVGKAQQWSGDCGQMC